MLRERECSSSDDEDADISRRSCGIGKCTPMWLQRFADSKVYLFFFCSTGILQGAYFTYFIGILSTLEKRYSFDSGITGIILIADNLSPALFVLLVGYYGKYAHRPRLVTFGMMISVFSCFLCCLPYFLYGPRSSNLSSYYFSSKNEPMLCNSTRNYSQKCDLLEQSESYTAIAILFIANFFNGFGSIAYYTIGTPYMDDNVKKKNSPLYLGATFALRVISPTLGFMLSSFCLKNYENPFGDPGFSDDDPRWIGAWWIGFLILGVALFASSFPISFFPRELEHLPVTEKNLQLRSTKTGFSDLLLSLKKLIQNPILVFHTLSITFQINGIFGYYVFMPKYMESQYQKTASSASFFSGTTSLITTIAGVFLGGILIQKVKPSPRYLTGYMVFVELFAGIGFVSSLFLGCPSPNISGLNKETKSFDLFNSCNENCGCSENEFDPICSDGAVTYFSSCFAGCNKYTTADNIMIFQNCSCIDTHGFDSNITDTKKGYCHGDCNMFLPYFIILSLSKVFASTAKVGNILVTLRCVNDEDKTLALGAVEFVVTLLATIPYPLIYGHVIDNCCLVWEENCGKRGNCKLYDHDQFRLYLHVLSIIFVLLGTCCDGVVFFLSKNMKNFYGNVPGAEAVNVQLEMERQDTVS